MVRLKTNFFQSLPFLSIESRCKNYLKTLTTTGCILLCLLSWQIKAQTLFEGFENWTETLGTHVPNGWTASSIVTNTDSSSFVNVSRVPALTEGQYALQITNDGVYGIEGVADNQISFPFDYPGSLVDITFTARCEGEGFCGFLMSPEAELWTVEAGGSELHTVVLENIFIRGRFGPTSLLFYADSKPINDLVPAYDGVSFLTIDDLQISPSVEPGSCNLTEPLTMSWLAETIENTNNCVGSVVQFEYNDLTYFAISPNYDCPPEVRPKYFACDGGLVCTQSADGTEFCDQNLATANINNGHTIWSSGNNCDDPFQLEIVQYAIAHPCLFDIYAFEYEGENYVYIDQQCEVDDEYDTLYKCSAGASCPIIFCEPTFDQIEDLLNGENRIWPKYTCDDPFQLEIVQNAITNSCTDAIYAFEYNNQSYLYIDNNLGCEAVDFFDELYNCSTGEACSINIPCEFELEEIEQLLNETNQIWSKDIDPDEKYPWLYEIVEPEYCAGIATEYDYDGYYTFVYLSGYYETGRLYFQDGTLYCSGDANYCLGLYNLREPINTLFDCTTGNDHLIVDINNFTCTNDGLFTIEVTVTDDVGTPTNGQYGIYNAYGEGLPDFIYFSEGETITYEGILADASNGLYTVFVYDRNLADVAAQTIEIDVTECLFEETIFDQYGWLYNIVDPNNCNGTKITEHFYGTYTFLYIEDNNNGTLYFQDGTFYCTDNLDNYCLSLYGFDIPATTWYCEDENEGCRINDPLSQSWVQDIIETSEENYVDAIILFEYEGDSYIRVTAGSVIIDGSSVETYNCNGTLLCFATIWYEEIYVEGSEEVCRASAINGETVWMGENSNLIFDSYPWLSSVVHPIFCQGTSIKVYAYGSYEFISIQDEEGKKLYFQDGTFYCADGPNYSCTGLYGLNEIKNQWTCSGVSQKQKTLFTPQKNDFSADFKVYPNPNKGQFDIDIERGNSDDSIQILDINGKVVETIAVDAEQKQIRVNLTNLPKGIYLLQRQSNHKLTTKQIIIQ